MKKYYNLSFGVYKELKFTEAEIWSSVQNFFYHGKNATSYKFILFKALLENITEVNDTNELTYKRVFDSFAAISWNLVACHKLEQASSKARKAIVQRIIEEAQIEYQIPGEWNYERIKLEQREIVNHKIKQAGKTNVIGATYGDFNEEIYSFNHKTERIQMNPAYVDFLLKYKRLLIDINNYQFALFLEKFNMLDKVSGILTKIEIISKRNSLKEFELLLKRVGYNSCFYCGCELKRKTHVDHFIPWSYVQNDRLWNFVLACSVCNTKKSNKLVSKDYLDIIIERNARLCTKAGYETYFENYSEDKLLKSYFYAQQNGFKRL